MTDKDVFDELIAKLELQAKESQRRLSETRVICPQCELEGKKSNVRMVGAGVVTDMPAYSFYDEDGTKHLHDPNRMAESGRCSNGHDILIVHSNQCYADGCDFGEPRSIRFTPRPEAKKEV